MDQQNRRRIPGPAIAVGQANVPFEFQLVFDRLQMGHRRTAGTQDLVGRPGPAVRPTPNGRSPKQQEVRHHEPLGPATERPTLLDFRRAHGFALGNRACRAGEPQSPSTSPTSA